MLFHLEAVSGIHKSRKHFSGAVSERYSEYVMLFCIVFEFFHQCLVVFCIPVFCLLGKFIPEYLILLFVMINRFISLISHSSFLVYRDARVFCSINFISCDFTIFIG